MNALLATLLAPVIGAPLLALLRGPAAGWLNVAISALSLAAAVALAREVAASPGSAFASTISTSTWWC